MDYQRAEGEMIMIVKTEPEGRGLNDNWHEKICQLANFLHVWDLASQLKNLGIENLYNYGSKR